MQKGKGKALRNFSLAFFSLVLKQDSANRMEAYMQGPVKIYAQNCLQAPAE